VLGCVFYICCGSVLLGAEFRVSSYRYFDGFILIRKYVNLCKLILFLVRRHYLPARIFFNKEDDTQVPV